MTKHENGSEFYPDAGPEMLERAAEIYAHAEHRGHQLEAMLYSIASAAVILDEAGFGEQLAPLHHLRTSISRLASGQEDEVLKPLRYVGQSGKSGPDGATMFTQVLILEAAEIFFRAFGGKRGARGRADRKAAELASQFNIAGGHGRPISHDMIRNWRSLSTGVGSSLVGEQLALRLAQHPPKWSRENAIVAATALMRRISVEAGIELSSNTPLTQT